MPTSVNTGMASPRQSDAAARRAADRKRPFYAWSLFGIFVLGVGLRILTMDTRGLWLDEAVTVDQTARPLWQVILTQVGGTHPPLFHILMHFWEHAFGLSEVALRSYALLFGAAAIPLAYWAGMRFYDRRTGLIAALILALSPYHIWYSQEARMYSMLMFFGLLSITTLMLAIRHNTWLRWLAFFVVTFLGTFSHYFFAFLVIGEALFFFFFEIVARERDLGRRGERRATLARPWLMFKDIPQLAGWLSTNLVIAVSAYAWLYWAVFFIPKEISPLLLSVSSGGLGYGQPGPSFAIRFNDVGMMLVEALTGFHPSQAMFALVAMWPLMIYLLLLLFDLAGPVNRRTSLLLCSASGIPMIWTIGQWQGQALASRYSMAVLAPVVILSAAVISWMPRRSRFVVLIAGALVALVAYTDQSFNPNNVMRYDNRRAIAYVAQKFKPGDIIIYEPFYTDVLFRYYLPKYLPAYDFPQHGFNGTVRDAKVQIGQDLSRVVTTAPRVWFVLSFQNIAKLRGDAYNTEMWFLRNGYKVKRNIQMNQVQVIQYERVAPPGSLLTSSPPVPAETLAPSAVPGTGTAPGAGVVPSPLGGTGGLRP